MLIAKYSGEPIGIIGLGYVGLPLALEFGKNRYVVGYDLDETRIQELNKGFDRTLECTEEKLKNAKSVIFTSSEEELSSCKIYIVTVPTPVDSVNRPNLTALKRASMMIGNVLKVGDIVIYESTVFPGATTDICVPELERSSGLVFNKDFFCGYSPERINPGDKVNSLATITKIVSGSTPEIADVVNDLYSEIILAGTWVAPSIEVAEAAKVIENTQRDINIAFANELSLIFGRMGIDTMDVLNAAGSKWNFLPYKPGLVGGHCIGVDPYYLAHKAEDLGYIPELILAARRLNDGMALEAAQEIIRRMIHKNTNISGAVIGVLGVTFKENCPDIRNSKVFDLIAELRRWGAKVIVADPVADDVEVANEYGIQITKELPDNCCDSVIVAVGHDQYRGMSPNEVARMLFDIKKAVLGDLKSILDRGQFEQHGFDIYRL